MVPLPHRLLSESRPSALGLHPRTASCHPLIPLPSPLSPLPFNPPPPPCYSLCLQVLEGAKALMKANPPPFILIEYYPFMLKINGVTASSFIKLASSYGYRIYDCQSKV